ncbi:hypothetical protein [Xenorhabdus bovienii]|uniref:HEPN domain-containing protein n=1 Tax=Xenorhabdus bovienii str. kraussei Becker Underwood TaxID=1398204 RepID=A0A077PT27_XENBV|nr:hypothetical protein [Xenorhabdus bovienii]CDH23946.1 conserved hypothetical protein [Xenorhabdus bovienii str. kraussei Becker Underwood]
MSILPREYLDSAKEMIDQNADEIVFRNCISRSYYGLYHSICAFLKHCPPTTHEGVITYLMSPSERKKENIDQMLLISLGAVLKQQKIKRHRADYDLLADVDFNDADTSILASEKIIDKMSSNQSKSNLQPSL